MSWGGSRIGSGRKSKNQAARWLAGDAGKRGQRGTAPEVSVSGASEVDMSAPAVLTKAEAAYWALWVELAASNGTLTTETRPGLALLCQVACRAARLWAEVERDGMTQLTLVSNPDGSTREVLKSHPQITQYRGLISRQEMLMSRYGLAGSGKPTAASKQPAKVDKFAEAAIRGHKLRAVK